MRNVIKALELLEAVSERQPAGVSELARALALPKSTVQRSLQTLAEAGWIRATGQETTRWVLTTKPLVVGSRASGRFGLRDAALPVMHRVRNAVNETTNLTLNENLFGVLLERLDSTHAVRTFAPLGIRVPLHASAAGRAILSRLPEDALRRVLEAPLPSFTPNTMTDRRRLLKEISLVRERGFATAASEWNDGVVAVAAPIVAGIAEAERAGGVMGALGVSGPLHRMPKERLLDLAPIVVEAAAEIAANLDGAARSVQRR